MAFCQLEIVRYRSGSRNAIGVDGRLPSTPKLFVAESYRLKGVPRNAGGSRAGEKSKDIIYFRHKRCMV